MVLIVDGIKEGVKTHDDRTLGQGELAGTLVLTVKTQLLEIIYFGNLTLNLVLKV